MLCVPEFGKPIQNITVNPTDVQFSENKRTTIRIELKEKR